MSGLFDGISIAAFPALHINPVEINDQILIHGNSGELRHSHICPCRRLETGLANAACPVCLGVGFVHPPELREPAIFLDHSRTASMRPNGPGLLVDGTVAITLPCGLQAAKGDLLLPDGETSIVQEMFHRSVQQVTNRMLVERRLMPDQRTLRLRPRACRLLYPTVTRIDSLYWVHGDRLVPATQGVDYRLVDNAIEWIVDGPPDGDGFSVRYQAPTAYQVHTAAPLYRSENNRQMPWSVTASRLDKLQIEADVR